MIDKRVYVVLLFALAMSVEANECKNLGDLKVFFDPNCAQGGAGCNAGGQGQMCRFCGFDLFPPCPTESTVKPSTTSKLPTTPRPTTPSKPPTSPHTKPTPSKPNDDANPNPSKPNQPKPDDVFNEYGERLIFSEDFDKFDLTIWKHDLTMSGGGNWEFQLYHNNRTNSFVKDGVLNIKPTLTGDRIGEANLKNGYRMDMWGGSKVDQCTGNNFYGCERIGGANMINPIQSAKITTIESFNFKYGRVEVRAKLPLGDWLWPAIWMLPATNHYGMWPASGEIDIMEGRGNANYPKESEGGVESFGSTLHWGVDWSQNRFKLTHGIYENSARLSDDFHTYGLYWSEDRLYTYFDDPENIVLDVDLTAEDFFNKGGFAQSYENPWKDAPVNAPFDQNYYLIINLAVGGTGGYFPDGAGGKPWSDKSSFAANEFYNAKNQWYPTWQEDSSFQIDSVKIWSFN